MKRFEFSLKKLQGYKEQLLKKEKNTLSELRRQMNLLLEEKESLIALRKEKCRLLDEKISKGLSPQHICVHKQYIDSIYDRMINLEMRITSLEKTIQSQLDVVIEITKELDSLEKLEKKQLEEYTKTERKQQELFIEEFVSHTSFVETR